MTQTETLKLALEALEGIRRYGLDTLSGRIDGPDDREWQRAGVNEMTKQARLAITAIKEHKDAYAQPEQEPVVESFMVHMYNFGYKAGHHDTVEGQYIDLDRRDMGTYHSDIVAEWVEDVGYHTTPPQRTWVGLTDEEVNDLYMEGMGIHATIEATEAKLKEKNNAALPEQGDKNDA